MLPGERTGIPHLPATPTEWWLSSDRIGFTGSSPEGPNSVRVTFSRRSPPMQAVRPSKSGAIARETGLELFSAGHVPSGKRSHTYRSPQRSGSHRREEHSPAFLSQKPYSVRVTFSRRSPKCRVLGSSKQVQSRNKLAWNSSRRSHVRSCNSFENTEPSGRTLE